MQGSLITPGLSLLKVIEGTVGEEFNSFVPLDANLSTVNSYSALTLILWVLFIVVMPVLFTNLLVSAYIKYRAKEFVHALGVIAISLLLDWVGCWRHSGYL